MAKGSFRLLLRLNVERHWETLKLYMLSSILLLLSITYMALLAIIDHEARSNRIHHVSVVIHFVFIIDYVQNHH